MTEAIFNWRCPEKGCGKRIKSLYKRQIEFLIEQHKLSHKNKKVPKSASNVA